MQCLICGAETAGAYLCHEDTTTLERALGDVTCLMEELEVTVHRLNVTGEGDGRGPTHPPLPLDVTAMQAGQDLRAKLLLWTHHVAKHHGREGLTAFTAEAMSGYLLNHTNWLRTTPAAGEAFEQITRAVRAVQRVIDLPPDQTRVNYLGPCGAVYEGVECDQELWAPKGAPFCRCRVCGTTWDTQQRRSSALAAIKDVAYPAAQITRALTSYQMEVSMRDLRYWHKIGILRKCVDGRSALYRVGDVVDAWTRMRG